MMPKNTEKEYCSPTVNLQKYVNKNKRRTFLARIENEKYREKQKATKAKKNHII